jgi:hypothetical protein
LVLLTPEIYEKMQAAAQIADPAEAESLYVEANNCRSRAGPDDPHRHGGSGTLTAPIVEGAHASRWAMSTSRS